MPPRRWTAALAALILVAATLTTMPTAARAADPPLPIAAIQGTQSSTPYAGKPVTTTPSVVTAVYGEGPAEFRGFVIQTPGTGGRKDLSTASTAVFVYLGNQEIEVEIGDQVSVSGTAEEFNGLTQIRAISVTTVPGRYQPVRPVSGLRWASTVAQRENLESMLYSTREKFIVSDAYPLLPFGELGLSVGSLPVQPTDVGPVGSPAATAQAARNLAIRVNLDDGSNRGYSTTRALPGRSLPFLTARQRVQVGDRLRVDQAVIVDFRNGLWKFNPTEPVVAGDEVATITSRRAEQLPLVGGAFSVASFNVLNYFTTTGQDRAGCEGGNLDSTGSFNVTFDCDVRGAWDGDDLLRQQDKIVTAIGRLDASVVGLMEIENSVRLGEAADEATATLVNALNTRAGQRTWAFVPSSTQLQDVASQDVITNALIYQPGKVKLDNGRAYALGTASGEGGAFANARTPIAAAFSPRVGGQRMLVVVNHFKSKSSGADATGDNADRGQGAFNGDRVRQAEALLDWLPKLQRESRAEATALLGDFNAYTQEDPLRTLAAAGYRNAAPIDTYTDTFGGLTGSLDHILLNRQARIRLTAADVWNINAGQSQALEYSTYRTTAVDYYTASALRSSDHDPVIAGFRKRPYAPWAPHAP